ncbi:DUF4386 domain-containing protein [Kineosporia sp. A_224]|uniref:DUF4386 domain-containing protein n=1 Tax=Kineosporia sp. A_224 TaxID=1962180 RepID=UPI000B4AFB5A|nr:DUF4386 domain-containing protein [Kineosporia sp. A_224]
MDLLRRTSITAGTLFVVATAASLCGNALLPAISGADRLARMAEHPDRTATAVLLSLVAAACSAGIAVALYPVLRTVDPALALGSVAFRLFEAVFYAVGAVCLLTVLSVADDLGPGTAVPAPARTAADVLVAAHRQAAAVGVLAFVVGAFLYYVVLFRSRLVPRWLSVWGVAALVVMGVAAVLAVLDDTLVTEYVALALPIGVQEMVLAAWLLVKGFRAAPTGPEPVSRPAAAAPGTTRPAR